MSGWATALPAVSAAFLSSLVEAVEALTIVLAVGLVRGWRPAAWGAICGLLVLAAIVVALGGVLNLIPIRVLQFAVGVLLLRLAGIVRTAITIAATLALHTFEVSHSSSRRPP